MGQRDAMPRRSQLALIGMSVLTVKLYDDSGARRRR